MKESLRKLFSPILNLFEADQGEYVYRLSHRKALIVLGLLCIALSAASLVFAIKFSQPGGALPIILFFTVGCVCEIVGCLGSDRAVARIWKRK